MKGELIPMFPTCLLLNNINRDFTEDELECILSYKNDVRENTGNFTTNDIFVLENSKLSGLKKIIEFALNDYLQQVYQPINDVKLLSTISWLNFTDKTQYHHKHCHHNSFVSGCLYINAKKESDCIVFTKRATGENWQLQPNQYNAFNSNEFSVPVSTGDLVLFPSNLLHSVPQSEHEYTRISLAFNSFFSGELGFVDGEMRGINYLKTNLPKQQNLWK
jgi:uncharacterized protein (TIGR02466 family)